jgi:hypothetical protein
MDTFVFAGQIDGYRSLQDKSLKVSIVTTTEVSPETVLNISHAFQLPCVIAVSSDPFTAEQIKDLDNIKVDFDDGGKTPGQRLRGVLYRMWEQNNERYTVFEDFYRAKMEQIITHYKNKLP